jgi:hypothetical protein
MLHTRKVKMIRLLLIVLFLMVTSNIASADWELYRKDKKVISSVDILSYKPFHGQPSVWVRWHYVTPKHGVGGRKIQFTANCSRRRLFEIARHPYNADGKYLTPNKHYDSPIEYPLTPNSLNEATYKLLCR